MHGHIADSPDTNPSTGNIVCDDIPPSCCLLSPHLTESVWFTRGWTLQELIAPSVVQFYDHTWLHIGNKKELSKVVSERTAIPMWALSCFDRKKHCIARIMHWAAGRKTARVEDRAYSLFGLFGINLPLLYGEGHQAFQRLQQELVRTSNDASILAWSEQPLSEEAQHSEEIETESSGVLLAPSPDCFLCDIPNFTNRAEKLTMHKEGLSGEFTIMQYCLDIYAIFLGSFYSFSHDLPESYKRRALTRRTSPNEALAKGAIILFVRMREESNSLCTRVSVYGREWMFLPLPASNPLRNNVSITLTVDGNASLRSECYDHHNYLAQPARIWTTEAPRQKRKLDFWDRNVRHTRNKLNRKTQTDQIIIAPGNLYSSKGHNGILFRDRYARKGSIVVVFGYDSMRVPTAYVYRVRNTEVAVRQASGDCFDNGVVVEWYTKTPCKTSFGESCTTKKLTTERGWPDFNDQQAFVDVDKERAHGSTVLKVCACCFEFKAVFIPQGNGHRVLLAFSEVIFNNFSPGEYQTCCFPRSWLYPPLEGK